MKRIYIVVIFFVVALLYFGIFYHSNYQIFNYFLPLADAMIHGRIDITPNPALNELVPSAGKYFVVYPPMPAVILIPFTLIFGSSFNQAIASILIAAASVSIFYLLATRFTKRLWVQILMTILFAFGTNFSFSALIGSAWHFAHIIAVFFLLLALLESTGKKRPIIIGFLYSAAFMARLPVFLAFPIFLYLILKDSRRDQIVKKLMLFFVPVVFILGLFGIYNFVRFGSFFQTGYSLIPGVLQEPWYKYGIFSVHYISRQLQAIFLSMPKFSVHFPYFLPTSYAMALWLTTPALFLLFGVRTKDKYSVVFLLTALLIALPSLMHGTVGFSQFGYRFSLDFIVFLLLPLIAVFERIGWKIAGIFVAVSMAINLWVAILYVLVIFKT